jgi:hypothetical protein
MLHCVFEVEYVLFTSFFEVFTVVSFNVRNYNEFYKNNL